MSCWLVWCGCCCCVFVYSNLWFSEVSKVFSSCACNNMLDTWYWASNKRRASRSQHTTLSSLQREEKEQSCKVQCGHSSDFKVIPEPATPMLYKYLHGYFTFLSILSQPVAQVGLHTHFVAQDTLKLAAILLSQLHKGWNYSHRISYWPLRFILKYLQL